MVQKIVDNNKKIYFILTYAIVLLTPTVILNSSMWGQCDSIYTAFVIISMINLIDEKYLRSIVFLGIAFAFKLQTAFILPLYLLFFLTNKQLRYKIHYFLVIPIVNIVSCLPSILVGRNIKDIIMIYYNQAVENNHYITLNFPNVYNFICNTDKRRVYILASNSYLPIIMILLMALVFFIFLVIFIKKKVKVEKKEIILVGLWSIMVATFLLPYMHDRYLYMADVLSFLYLLHVLSSQNVKYHTILLNAIVPIGVQIISLYSYHRYFSGVDIINRKWISLINLVIVIYLTVIVLKTIYEKEKVKE